MNETPATSLIWSLAIVCTMAAQPALAEERICTDTDDSRPVQVRWMPDVTVELRGKRYSGKEIHWRDDGGWRTGGKYYRTAGFDDHGVHRIYLKETRYEYFPGGTAGDGGVLHHYTTKRPTSPEDEAKVRQNKYDHPYPPAIPAARPIQTGGFNRGMGFSHYTLTCAIPDDELKMASDYTVWDIVKIYFQTAIQEDGDSGEEE